MQSSMIPKILVGVVVIGILIAFGVILLVNINAMGGYDWAFDANKSRTERAAGASITTEAEERAARARREASTSDWSLRYASESGMNESLPLPVPSRVVVLVHGLDDPGWTLNTMLASLVDAGHVVARFDYPNDQAITLSATMLAEAMETLRVQGVGHVDIVAHSMGGLVARELLTREDLYGGKGTGGTRFPTVDLLIMLGTPNHGSTLARLQSVSDIGERLSRLWQGHEGVFDFENDGDSQAARDLMPGSPFLERLNARRTPDHTKLTIIAGRMSPIDVDAFGAWIDNLASSIDTEKLPEWLRSAVDDASSARRLSELSGLIDGVGDGVVSIDSTRLDGIEDHVVVDANHLTMLVDVMGVGEPPPAIPIVLERLDAARSNDQRDGSSTDE